LLTGVQTDRQTDTGENITSFGWCKNSANMCLFYGLPSMEPYCRTMLFVWRLSVCPPYTEPQVHISRRVETSYLAEINIPPCTCNWEHRFRAGRSKVKVTGSHNVICWSLYAHTFWHSSEIWHGNRFRVRGSSRTTHPTQGHASSTQNLGSSAYAHGIWHTATKDGVSMSGRGL